MACSPSRAANSRGGEKVLPTRDASRSTRPSESNVTPRESFRGTKTGRERLSQDSSEVSRTTPAHDTLSTTRAPARRAPLDVAPGRPLFRCAAERARHRRRSTPPHGPPRTMSRGGLAHRRFQGRPPSARTTATRPRPENRTDPSMSQPKRPFPRGHAPAKGPFHRIHPRAPSQPWPEAPQEGRASGRFTIGLGLASSYGDIGTRARSIALRGIDPSPPPPAGPNHPRHRARRALAPSCGPADPRRDLQIRLPAAAAPTTTARAGTAHPSWPSPCARPPARGRGAVLLLGRGGRRGCFYGDAHDHARDLGPLPAVGGG